MEEEYFTEGFSRSNIPHETTTDKHSTIDMFEEYPSLPKELSSIIQKQNLRLKNISYQLLGL